MKAKKLIVKVIISACLLSPACIPAMAQDISEKEAYNAAREIVSTTFPGDSGPVGGGIYIRDTQKTGYPFYICDVAGGGFVLR